MSDQVCISCRKPKAVFNCALCEEDVCKSCVQLLDSETFTLLAKVPEKLKHTHYCGPCYDQEVAPELEAYEETLDRAKEAFIFFTTQRKEIPLIRRSNQSYSVKSCIDRDETILRLAFFAAQEGFNAVIEVDVGVKKIRNAGHQTSDWSGTGVGAMVDEKKLDRQHRQNQIYR